MWAVVKIKAWDSSTSRWQMIYEGEADPNKWQNSKETNQYNHFEPSVCQTTFTTSVIRIEMDTYAIADWNEVDYVKVVGATSLKAGVLTTDTTTQTARVMFVPDLDFTGVDSFTFVASDCAYDPGRTSQGEITVSVLPVNDPPVAQSSAVVAMCAPGVSDEITLQASDVDVITEANTSIAFAIASLPTNAALYDATSGALITPASLPVAVSGGEVLLLADYDEVTEAPSGFEFMFIAIDEMGAVSSAASVAITCSATECSAGEYFDMPNRRCTECPAGMFASDAGIRSSCELCAVGTSAGAGSTSCASCDTYYVAPEKGSPSCKEIPSGTRWINASSYRVNPGMWRPKGARLNDIYECPITEACPGGNGYGTTLCADGFVGPLCSHCDSAYFLSWFVFCCSCCCFALLLTFCGCCQVG